MIHGNIADAPDAFGQAFLGDNAVTREIEAHNSLRDQPRRQEITAPLGDIAPP